MKVKNLVIGAGLSGAVIADRLACRLKEPVLLIEKRGHIAGNAFDFKDNNGIIIHKYGPHVFHTNSQKVWQYLSGFTQWYDFVSKPQAFVEGKLINIPFNLNSLYKIFPQNKAMLFEQKLIQEYGLNSQIGIFDLQKSPDKGLRCLGDAVYEKIYKNYTLKQWGCMPEEVDSSVISRIPVCINRDDRIFKDTYQGIPVKGYADMIEKMLLNKNIELLLNTDFNSIKNTIKYERLFCTSSIDEFFDFKFGVLPYRSLRFDICEKGTEYFQSCAIVNYPNDHRFTRICEHKYFLNTKSKKTTVSYEYPEEFQLGKNDRFYPVVNSENIKLYNKYLIEVKKNKKYFFSGQTRRL